MDMIKKIALELWCMAYGAMLFFLAWWIIVVVATLITFIMCVVYVVTPKKNLRRSVDKSQQV
jgi:hypothetical protein